MTHFWKTVSKEKFFNFIGKWPRDLITRHPEYYDKRPITDYHDDSLGEYPANMVAYSCDDYPENIRYFIRVDLEI